MNIYQASLKRNGCKVILANGSERGDFVGVDYIFNQFGRIHDGIQLMKTYYPDDPMWTVEGRISDHTAKVGVSYAWDYEYEDYHPFDVFEINSKTIKEMKEVVSYGSELHLTLTLDLSLGDDDLISIVKVLRNYGKVYLRINHEVNGEWFRYNVYNTHEEVGKFFVKFHKIVKQYSSNIFTVLNITADSFMEDGVALDYKLGLDEPHMREALALADFWAIDKYSSLHYGWPFSEKATSETSFGQTVDDWWLKVEEAYLKMIWKNGGIAKKVIITEFNSDSDVDGYEGQGQVIREVYDKIAKANYEWLEGIVLYQFRDYGGLGIEKGNNEEFVTLDSFRDYKDALKNFKFELSSDISEWKREDYAFYWDGIDSMRGLEVRDYTEGNFTNRLGYPVFIVDSESQQWTRVEVEETISLSAIHSFIILIPPVFSDLGRMKKQFMIRDIKEVMLTCLS